MNFQNLSGWCQIRKRGHCPSWCTRRFSCAERTSIRGLSLSPQLNKIGFHSTRSNIIHLIIFHLSSASFQSSVKKIGFIGNLFYQKKSLLGKIVKFFRMEFLLHKLVDQVVPLIFPIYYPA